MSLLSDSQLRADVTMIARVTSAILKAAGDIRNESSDAASHADRIAWANSLVTQSAAAAEAARMIVSVSGNSTVSSGYAATGSDGVPDSDLEFVVNGLVDTYASNRA